MNPFPREGLATALSDDFDRSLQRILDSEEARALLTGFGTTKQGQVIVREYLPSLAEIIRANRASPDIRERAVWRPLKGISIEDIAARLLIAGISACWDDTLGADDEGHKTYLNQALWIADNLVYIRDRELAANVGIWGINRLLGLRPLFDLAGDILIIPLTDSIDTLLTEVVARSIKTNPLLSPLASPPEPWTQVRTGGLPAGHWARPSLIRGHRRTVEDVARKAIGTGAMQPVLDAVNYLQSTAFSINEPVLDFASKMPPPAPDLDSPRDVRSKAAAKFRTWHLAKSTAEVTAALDRFWIPDTIDFRGRIYPLCHFSFAREDFIRGLFLFADGEPIGAEGTLWLKAHVAARADGTTWSPIKKPSDLDREGRVAWTNENLDLLRKIGEAVLNGGEPSSIAWALPKKPVQFIAACAELVQALDIGPNFVTRLPLTFDGSCSGLQHLCALINAPEGRFVNLIDDPEADDFYRRISFKVLNALLLAQKICAAAIGEESAALTNILNHYDRDMVKRPVMSFFYGARAGGFDEKGRPHGMVKQVIEELKKRNCSTRGAMILAHAIYAAVEDTVPLAKQVRDYAETVAKLCAEQNIALRWPNPLGMSVICTYNDPEIKEVYTRINGRRRRVNVTIGNSPEINGRASAQAAAANLTHSCDAAHLQMVALTAAKEGIQIVPVHDCFGCLAPRTGRFKEIINEQFYQLHEHHNMLVGLRDSAEKLIKGRLPKFPDFGPAQRADVLTSRHAFK